MGFEYDRIVEITTLPNSAGAVFANPAGQKTYIRLVVLHNSNSTAEAVKLYNVPDNAGAVGTAGATNEFYSRSMAAGETVTMEFAIPGLVLEDENDTIQGVTTTASKVTIQAYGGKE